MSRLHLALFTINAAFTGSAALSLVPVAVVYPGIAEVLASERAGSEILSVLWDALLCFGPLALPFFLALGIAAIRAAWLREPVAVPLNGSAVAAWCATSIGILLAVTL